MMFTDLGYGITCIDTGYKRPGLAAAYLIIEEGHAAFVDTGTCHSVARFLQLLDEKQIALTDVDFVIPTHVHLDHAGGSGELMRLFPNARLVVHPRGARHLIDPSKLIQGATAVYGEAVFKADYGELVPVAEERVVIADDGFTLDLNGRRLEFLDTPGHASHHFSIWDQRSAGFFTGDTFGLSYREMDVNGRASILPTTTPVQFAPDAWAVSLKRMEAYSPECMYLTHFGKVSEVPRLMADLKRKIIKFRAIAEACDGSEQRYVCIYSAMLKYLSEQFRADGLTWSPDELDQFLKMDLELNAQGLEVWLDRQARARRGS